MRFLMAYVPYTGYAYTAAWPVPDETMADAAMNKALAYAVNIAACNHCQVQVRYTLNITPVLNMVDVDARERVRAGTSVIVPSDQSYWRPEYV